VSTRVVLAMAIAISVLPVLAAAQLTKLPEPGEFKPKQDLSDYRTYAWNHDQVPAESLANHLRIINAIQAQMKENGYRIDTIRPQLRIRYRLEVTERVQGNPTQQRSVWDDANSTIQIDFSREKQAGLSIEILDAESSFLLWNAKGTYPLGTPDRAERQINDAVADVFKQYPAKD